MTDGEKKELLLDMARNMSAMRDDYRPYLTDGLIMHSSPCIIKSTLKGRPAWSDACVAMVYKDGDVHSQIPEYRAERWHDLHDSFDILPDSVLASKPIYPVLYDDVGLWFTNGASVQRCYYDLFWVTHRDVGLRFEQDDENVNSVVLVFDDTGLVGSIMPRALGDNRDDILPLVKILIQFHEYGTEEPCDKCGSTEDVWLWAKDRSLGNGGIPICHWCYLDSEGFTEYLAASFEDALASNPDEWEKLQNGKWRRKESE